MYINNIIYEGTKLTKRMKPHAENINKKKKHANRRKDMKRMKRKRKRKGNGKRKKTGKKKESSKGDE